ncbi:MAG: hypothetical protein EOP49_24730, partial [Sphingobacteriales bacterium]
MEKLHHQTLKSAVSKYLPLLKEGKTPDDIKAAIALDEKKYSEEAINEILDAIIEQDTADNKENAGSENKDNQGNGADPRELNNPGPGNPNPAPAASTDNAPAAPPQTGNTGKGGYFVKSPFRDINDFNLQYSVGDDVSHFGKQR